MTRFPCLILRKVDVIAFLSTRRSGYASGKGAQEKLAECQGGQVSARGNVRRLILVPKHVRTSLALEPLIPSAGGLGETVDRE